MLKRRRGKAQSCRLLAWLAVCVLLQGPRALAARTVRQSAHMPDAQGHAQQQPANSAPTLPGANDAQSEMALCADHPAQSVTYGKVRLPSLRVEASFRSKRPRFTTDITLVTQCSLDRLNMLESQCNSWGGILSAAVYYPLLHFNLNNSKGLASAKLQLEQFHRHIDTNVDGCRLDVALVSETIKAQDLWAYPYNALRNQALSRARTEIVLMVDVDFVVSAGLHDQLSAAEQHSALVEDACVHRNVIVLPAFETNPSMGMEAGTAAAMRGQTSNKEALSQMFQARTLIQFAEFYPAGHKATNYKKWFSTNAPYPIKFKVGYEPYILVSRRFMPWYDERFRGYGWDKVMQVYQLDAMGFHFVAHPLAFVVHRPHLPSSGYNHTFTGEAYTTRHKPTDHLWKMERIAKDMMAELKAGTYPEEGVTSLAHCREKANKQADRKANWW